MKTKTAKLARSEEQVEKAASLYLVLSAGFPRDYSFQAAIELVELGYVPIHWRHVFGDEVSDALNECLREDNV